MNQRVEFYNDIDRKVRVYNTQAEVVPDYIGRGLDELYLIQDGKLETNGGKDRIVQSLRNIIETQVKQRFFLPNFGSRIYEYLFEQNDFLLKQLVQNHLKALIPQWEKRITLNDVIATPSKAIDGQRAMLHVEIIFTINGLNQVENYVFDMNREIPAVGWK